MLASYKRHFFKINLPFKVEANLSDYSTENLSRFIHEYIHFLKNAFTPWGLYTSFQFYNKIKNKFNYIKETHGEIKIPVDWPEPKDTNWLNEIYTVGEGKRYSEANREIDGIQFNHKSTINYHRKKININGRNRTMVTIDIDTVPHGIQEIILGAWIIKESMAQIIQSSIWEENNDAEKKYVLPYDFVTVFCEQWAPKVSLDKEKQISICWASLFSMCPGETFLELLDYAQQNSHLSAKEIFDFYINDSKIRLNDSHEEIPFEDFIKDLRKKFLDHLEVFLNLKCDYFNLLLSDKSSIDVFEKVLKILGETNPENIDLIIQELGMPVVFGDGNSSCFSFVKDDPDSLAPTLKLFAYEQIDNCLNSQNEICPFYNLCEKDETIEKQYACRTNPLTIEIDCPMYFASKIAGIHNRQIVK